MDSNSQLHMRSRIDDSNKFLIRWFGRFHSSSISECKVFKINSIIFERKPITVSFITEKKLAYLQHLVSARFVSIYDLRLCMVIN